MSCQQKSHSQHCKLVRKSVLWPPNSQFYDVIVHYIDKDGRFQNYYDNGDMESLEMTKKNWQLASIVYANARRV